MDEKIGKEFQDNIEHLKEIRFYIGPCYGCRSELETNYILFDGDNVNDGRGLPLLKRRKGMVAPLTAEDMRNEIRKLNIGEWSAEYFNPNVLDGTMWDIEFIYDNEMPPVKIEGTNAYPRNFKALLRLFRLEDFEL